MPNIYNSKQAYNGPLTAFGSINVAEEIPIEQIMFQYGLPDKVEVLTATGGSVTSVSSMAKCSTGTSVGGYGVCRSIRALIYRPGQGALAKFTCVFTEGVANSLQFGGLFSATDALCFGYNGAQFGVLRRYGGALEIQQFTVDTAAGGSETLTLTLNDVAHAIPVTAGTVQHNAYEIATWLTANQTAWKCESVDDTIYLLAQSVGDKTGAFTDSSTGTLDGTFTQLRAGADNIGDWTYMSDWNSDNVPGFDPTKGNVYKIEFQYLGFGAIRFYIEHQDTGKFVLVHTINYQNRNTIPSLENPSLKCGIASASLGSTTNLDVYMGSMEIATQGVVIKREESHGYSVTKSVASGTANDPHLMTLRNRIIYSDKPNLSEVRPIVATAVSESSKSTVIKIYKNAIVNGESNFQFVDEDYNTCEVDTTATSYNSNGTLVAVEAIPPGGFARFDFEKIKVILTPGETLSFFAYIASGAASDVTVAVSWEEDL